jgi:hypothetical protein
MNNRLTFWFGDQTCLFLLLTQDCLEFNFIKTILKNKLFHKRRDNMKKYLAVIPIMVIMALVVIVSGCIGNDNVKIVGDNLQVSGLTLDENSTYPTVNGTIKNTGSSNLSYVPVNVSFYDSSGDLQSSVAGVVINLGSGEEENFSVESSSITDIKSYKVIVGDSKTNITSYAFAESLKSVIDSYNRSKGVDTNSVDVRGTPIDAVYASSGTPYLDTYPVDVNATIFLEMNSGSDYVGQWVYQSSGEVVSGYKPYVDVVVVYWPEMKVAGWHRLYGSSPDVETTGYGGDIQGDGPDIEAWINSLPKK